MNLDLVKLRKQLKTKVSQQQLAERLGLSQTQISRYEADPGSVPFELLGRWLAALGTSLAAVVSADAPILEGKIDAGDPYGSLRRRLALLADYIDVAPDAARGEAGEVNLDLTALAHVVAMHQRKPNVTVVGQFDTGKSRLCNSFMGSGHLPTAYQPATRVITYVRHLEDRPAWFREDVWLFDQGFDPRLWDDEAHCTAHRLLAGNLETLRQYGTHAGPQADQLNAHAAVVYLDAPVLRACNLVDLPGYQNTVEDTDRADAAAPLVDVLIYASMAKGFLDGEDFAVLRRILLYLPVYEERDAEFPHLGHLFLVATHADPSIKAEGPQGLEGIRMRAADRLHAELGESVFGPRAELVGRTMSVELLESRIFTFWAESPDRRVALETELADLLAVHLPRARLLSADQEIRDFKENAKARLAQQLAAYEGAAKNVAELKPKYDALRQAEPERQQKIAAQRAEIRERIQQCKAETQCFLSETYEAMATEYAVEQVVAGYQDRKQAQMHAASRVLEQLEHRLQERCLTLGRQLEEAVNRFLALYEAQRFSRGARGVEVEIPFNAQGAFLGGLAGMATIGALAIWASTLGNLGTYIIGAKFVRLLASVGIRVGGTAAFSAAMAAIGGPVTLAAALLVITVMGGWALLGDSWQRRLAKKIAQVFKENDVQGRWRAHLDQYWDDTAKAFCAGADKVEEEYQRYLSDLAALVNDPAKSPEQLRARIASTQEAYAFFVGIPWRMDIPTKGATTPR